MIGGFSLQYKKVPARRSAEAISCGLRCLSGQEYARQRHFLLIVRAVRRPLLQLMPW
jgi:hypothetical protein